jgi:phosphatidylethanolamine/phosphatidyl-N-methylethanolamine N-methyltransferase
MSAKTFAREFIKNWKATGAVLPSSRGLAQLMVKEAQLHPTSHILELGPGTGPITEVIAEQISAHMHYVGIELNDAFVSELQARFPKLHFIHGAAQDVDLTTAKAGAAYYDAVISGLPWTAFPESLQDAILDHVMPHLAAGGRFITFAYAGLCHLKGGRLFRQKLQNLGGRLETTPIVWANVPPAFVYVLTK